MISVMPNEGLAIKLAAGERAQLEQWESAQGTPQQVALRCRVVLAALAGEDNVSIAQELGVSRPTVQLWRRRVHEGGIGEVWKIAPGRGRKPKFDQAKRDQIAASRSYVELLRDYWLRRADVEQLLAGRLPRVGAASTPERAQAEVSSAQVDQRSRHGQAPEARIEHADGSIHIERRAYAQPQRQRRQRATSQAIVYPMEFVARCESIDASTLRAR